MRTIFIALLLLGLAAAKLWAAVSGPTITITTPTTATTYTTSSSTITLGGTSSLP